MKILSTLLFFVFLFTCTTSAQEKKNPLEGTTWELTSGKWVREDTTFTFPASPYDQAIWIFGKTHWALVNQDTSLKVSMSLSGTYIVDGDNVTQTFKMAPNYKEIGASFTWKFQIDGDQLTVKSNEYHFGGYKWEGFHQVWNSTTKAQEKKNPLEGTTLELISAKWLREDTTFTSPASLYDQTIMIFGKSHWAYVNQDTSRKALMTMIGKYSVDGDNLTQILKVAPNYKDIGSSYTQKFQIDGDQVTFKATEYHFGGYQWKGFDQVWKRID